MICKQCGFENNENFICCTQCGAVLKNTSKPLRVGKAKKIGTAVMSCLLTLSICTLLLIGCIFCIYIGKNHSEKSEFSRSEVEEDVSLKLQREEPSVSDNSETVAFDVDGFLTEKAKELVEVDLNGLKYTHYIAEVNGKSKYQCDGLKGAEGTFYNCVYDIDADGQMEMLSFSLVYNDGKITGSEKFVGRKNEYHVKLSIFEVSSQNLLVCQDSLIVSYGLFSPMFDSGDMRVFIKDNKYICVDTSILCCLEGDGAEVGMGIYTYNGSRIHEETTWDHCGPDWYEVGRHCPDFYYECVNLGFEETTYMMYTFSRFGFSPLDKGMDSICRIRAKLCDTESDDQKDTVLSLVLPQDELMFLLPNSSNQLLEEKDIIDLSLEELKQARYEILAKRGFVFEDEWDDYFGEKSWYCPSHGNVKVKEKDLSMEERQNIQLMDDRIAQLEEEAAEKEAAEKEATEKEAEEKETVKKAAE